MKRPGPTCELRHGFDTQARLLGVVLLFESSDEMVIRAVPSRMRYWELLP